MDWQPISTAPKDGTRILGYGVLSNIVGNEIATISWDTFNKQWNCNPNEATEYSPDQFIATHWMQLPPPPSS